MSPRTALQKIGAIYHQSESSISRIDDWAIYFAILCQFCYLGLQGLLPKNVETFIWILPSVIYIQDFGFKMLSRKGKTYSTFEKVIDGIVILASILPFLPSIPDAFKLFQLVAVFKLFGYESKTLSHLNRTLKLEWKNIRVILTGLVIMMGILSVVILYVERSAQPEKITNIFDAFWFIATTLSTAGFGDIYPVTPVGRGIIIVTYFVGMIAFQLPNTIFASRLTTEMAAEENQSNGVIKVQIISQDGRIVEPSSSLVHQFTDGQGNTVVQIRYDQ
jgi:Ion channel